MVCDVGALLNRILITTRGAFTIKSSNFRIPSELPSNRTAPENLAWNGDLEKNGPDADKGNTSAVAGSWTIDVDRKEAGTMKSRFRVNSRSGPITQEDCVEGLGADSITPGPSRFASGFEELLGEDVEPDPQFFVECWTLGVPQAIGNLQFRLRTQADRDEESVEVGLLEELFSSVLPWVGVRHFNFNERSGFSRSGVGPGSETEACAEGVFAEKYPGGGERAAYPMTLERARQLLGVGLASTQTQIKAAFRQKVREWHPDRLSDQHQVARQFDNEKMTEINEAYRLLRLPVV